eukprot:5704783-Pleurochrysis_carterae.AAC.2
MNRLHDALKPILRLLRPVISPLIERGPKRRLDQAISIADLRECARRRMHPMAFAYLDAGADDEVNAFQGGRDFARVLPAFLLCEGG